MMLHALVQYTDATCFSLVCFSLVCFSLVYSGTFECCDAAESVLFVEVHRHFVRCQYLCVCVRARARVCVCVCAREREQERERKREIGRAHV